MKKLIILSKEAYGTFSMLAAWSENGVCIGGMEAEKDGETFYIKKFRVIYIVKNKGENLEPTEETKESFTHGECNCCFDWSLTPDPDYQLKNLIPRMEGYLHKEFFVHCARNYKGGVSFSLYTPEGGVEENVPYEVGAKIPANTKENTATTFVFPKEVYNKLRMIKATSGLSSRWVGEVERNEDTFILKQVWVSMHLNVAPDCINANCYGDFRNIEEELYETVQQGKREFLVQCFFTRDYGFSVRIYTKEGVERNVPWKIAE